MSLYKYVLCSLLHKDILYRIYMINVLLAHYNVNLKNVKNNNLHYYKKSKKSNNYNKQVEQ